MFDLDLLVPENLVWGLIGGLVLTSQGSEMSLEQISRFSVAEVNKHRQIHLGGSAQQIALAKQRVDDEYVYAELMRQAGGQPQQTAVRSQQSPIQQRMQGMSDALYPKVTAMYTVFIPTGLSKDQDF